MNVENIQYTDNIIHYQNKQDNNNSNQKYIDLSFQK